MHKNNSRKRSKAARLDNSLAQNLLVVKNIFVKVAE